MPSFEREDRYIVIKRTDLEDAAKTLHKDHLESLDILLSFVRASRAGKGKKPLQCVVVESDWPEYESTWDAIEKRVSASEKPESPVQKGMGWPML